MLAGLIHTDIWDFVGLSQSDYSVWALDSYSLYVQFPSPAWCLMKLFKVMLIKSIIFIEKKEMLLRKWYSRKEGYIIKIQFDPNYIR